MFIELIANCQVFLLKNWRHNINEFELLHNQLLASLVIKVSFDYSLQIISGISVCDIQLGK